jgi:ABC-2 type transport system permease protein
MESQKMNDLLAMIWIELRKAMRSRMPLWTTLGSLFMPLGVAGLILLAKNPQLTQRLGLLSDKASLMNYSATDWSSYFGLSAEIISAGGFFFFIIATSWIFGREFVDGTVKDLLAVPVPRSSLLIAKFIVSAAWSAMMAAVMLIFSLVAGALIRLPGGSTAILLQGIATTVITACLIIPSALPFSLFASLGRGYILPMAMAVLTLITANLLMVVGWAAYFPWAVPLLYSQGDSSLMPASYWIVGFTSLAGMLATYLWWKYADQNR